MNDQASLLHPQIEENFRTLLKSQQIETDLLDQLYRFYLPIADWIAAQPQPFVVGINGAQGSGKSTLALILELLLSQHHSLRVASLSIDDLYKSRAERQQMADEIHPLLVTRGVPGTHDVNLGLKTIASLLVGDATAIPRFDKASDNPLPRSEWPLFEGHADVVIFEGWCIGAIHQSDADLTKHTNSLEQEEDQHGVWRGFVNRQLQHNYPELFDLIDGLIMLEIPEYAKIIEWRTLQESKLRTKEDAPNSTMDEAMIKRFVMHFERLSRFMLAEMPQRADMLLSINHQHQIDKIEIAE